METAGRIRGESARTPARAIIKAITLWQPWATLIAIGEKQYETRTWAPTYRGPIAIHAASKRDKTCLGLCREEPFREVLAKHGITSASQLPFGAIVAMARLKRVVFTGVIRPGISEQELDFGDFSKGRNAWELGDVMPLKQPIAAPGARNLWDWESPYGFINSYLDFTTKGNQ